MSTAIITSYTSGDLIDFFFNIFDEEGNVVDPTTVAFVYSCGSVGPITLTYTSPDSTPATSTVWRTDTGTPPTGFVLPYYTARVDSTGLAGIFNGAAVTTGIGQAAQPIRLVVTPNPAY